MMWSIRTFLWDLSRFEDKSKILVGGRFRSFENKLNVFRGVTSEMSDSWWEWEIFTSHRIPIEFYSVSFVILNVESNFLFLACDAVSKIDFVLRLIGETLEYDVFVESFSWDHEFRNFIRIEKSLHCDLPLLHSYFSGFELDVEGFICFRRHCVAVLVDKPKVFVSHEIPFHCRWDLAIIFQRNR